MAVKPEIIKARLKALFPKANLSQKRLDALAAKLSQKPADDADEAAIDEVLITANDYHSFEDIAKDDDRIRTLEASKPTPAPTPQDLPTPAPTPTPTEEMPAWVQKLMDKVDNLEKRNEKETKQSLAQKALAASKGLPEAFKAKWGNRIDLGSEISFEDQVKALEEEYIELKQSIADKTDVSGSAPEGGPVKGPSAAELDSVVDSMY